MARIDGTLGLIGCGQLGGAIARRLLASGAVAPERLWICNRSGAGNGLDTGPELNWTTDPGVVADRCDVVLLALPPAIGATLRLPTVAGLLVSVMAGVRLAQLRDIGRTDRVVRAMSNPAAEAGMAYSPWCADPHLGAGDRLLVQTLLTACGTADEVADEAQIDVFTAITGPVPGFVAYFAACVQDYAQQQGIEPGIARRAVGQLFAASGQVLAASERPAEAFVQDMVDYAGTTAAGLNIMRGSGLSRAIAEGLEAARQRCRSIGQPDD